MMIGHCTMGHESQIRTLQALLADAHIIELHPEFHGRCITKINELESELATAKNLASQHYSEFYDQMNRSRDENAKLRKEVERLDFLHKNDHSLADQWQAQNEELRAKLDRTEKLNAAYLAELADYGKTVARLRSELDEVKKNLQFVHQQHITDCQVENT